MEAEQTNINSSEIKIHIPPPIFIRSELDYLGFCNAIKNAIGSNEFACKSNLNELKLQTYTPDLHKNVMHLLKEKKVNFHTYLIQQEKPFRVVIHNLHHTTDLNFINEELKTKEYAIQVVNVLQWQTKKPLPLFFVDLKLDRHNSDIFTLFRKDKIRRTSSPSCSSMSTLSKLWSYKNIFLITEARMFMILHIFFAKLEVYLCMI